MTMVDSSVWIDFFNGRPTSQTERLDGLLALGDVVVGDLIVAEVLQGFRRERDYREAVAFFRDLLPPALPILGFARALSSSAKYRALRRRGSTVRQTSDVLIASYCIDEGLPLLFADRDFAHFVAAGWLREA